MRSIITRMLVLLLCVWGLAPIVSTWQAIACVEDNTYVNTKDIDTNDHGMATITFTIDDSYKDAITVVKPLFDQYNFKAGIGVIRDHIQKATYSNGIWYLTEDDIKSLYADGWEMLSHGLDFSNISTGENLFAQPSSSNPVSSSGYTIEQELVESKAYIEQLIGKDTVDGFIIPNLYVADEYTDMLKASYHYALGMGSSDANFAHPRTAIMRMSPVANQTEEDAQNIADNMIKNIDKAIEEGGELNIYFHVTDQYIKQIYWSNSDCIYTSLEMILEYVKAKQDQGLVQVKLPREVYNYEYPYKEHVKKTYFVSADGTGDGLSDSNPMSLEQVNSKKFYSGDTILFKRGDVFYGTVDPYIIDYDGSITTISAYGKGEAPIIYGESDACLVKLQSNMKLTNLHLVGSKSDAIVFVNKTYGDNIVRNTVISDNVIENIGGNAITVHNIKVDKLTVERNVIRNVYGAAFTVLGEKVPGKVLPVKNILVKNNLFVANTIDLAIWGNRTATDTANYEFCNNITVNQGRGQGYDAIGEDSSFSQKEAAHISTVEFINDKTDIYCHDNVIYNPRKVYYVEQLYGTEKLFKEQGYIRSDNNTYYLDDNTKILNENYLLADCKAFSNAYNKDANSSFIRLKDVENDTQLGIEYIVSSATKAVDVVGVAKAFGIIITIPVEKVDVAGHTIVVDKAVAATCTTPGKTKGSHCKNCGYVFETQLSVKATGHKWDSGKLTRTSTCTVKGVKTYKCTVNGCGGTKNVAQAIKADNHVKTTLKNAKKATTKVNGYTGDRYCSACNKRTAKGYVICRPKAIYGVASSYVYSGGYIKPTITIKDTNGKVITASHYTVSYKNNKLPGAATITVTFRGNRYYGTMSKSFKIILPKTRITSVCGNNGTGKMSVYWNTKAKVTGYIIKYTTKTSTKVSSVITKYKKVVGATKRATTINGLLKGKRYNVYIRTYLVAGGKTYYGAY